MSVIVVGVADMKISSTPGDIIVTHALGSCLGIAIHDSLAHVGGIMHVMLPKAKISQEKADKNPMMFVDSGVPLFFKEAFAAGAARHRLVVKVAGGATTNRGDDVFAIGKRNCLMLRNIFWKNGILITKEDVGGFISRTLYLEIGTGRTWIHSDGKEWDL